MSLLQPSKTAGVRGEPVENLDEPPPMKVVTAAQARWYLNINRWGEENAWLEWQASANDSGAKIRAQAHAEAAAYWQRRLDDLLEEAT